MRAALIDPALTVVNLIRLPDDWTGKAGEWAPLPAYTVVVTPPSGVSIGDVYDPLTQTFSPGPVAPPPVDKAAALKAAIDEAVAVKTLEPKIKAVLTEWKLLL